MLTGVSETALLTLNCRTHQPTVRRRSDRDFAEFGRNGQEMALRSLPLITECAKRFAGGQLFVNRPPTIFKMLAPLGLR